MVGYFGSKGDRLRISRNINQFVNGVRPYPRLSPTSPILPGASLGNMTEVGSFGESRYHGLWISANQRLSRGLQFNAFWDTLSKSTDFNSLSSQGVVVQDSFNLADSEGPSDFDARHRFVINAIYELPFTGNWLKEGWQVGLIVQAQTGNPISIVTAINTFTGVAITLRPDLVGDPAIVGTLDKWFEQLGVRIPRISGSCGAGFVFALLVSPEGAFHFGNLGRNAIRGPGFSNTDLSLIKNTRVGPPSCSCASRRSTCSIAPTSGNPGASPPSAARRLAWSPTPASRPATRLGAADSVRDQGALLTKTGDRVGGQDRRAMLVHVDVAARSLCAQGTDRIHACGEQGRSESGHDRDKEHQGRRQHEHPWVARADVGQQRPEHSRQTQRPHYSCGHAGGHQPQGLPQEPDHDAGSGGAESAMRTPISRVC